MKEVLLPLGSAFPVTDGRGAEVAGPQTVQMLDAQGNRVGTDRVYTSPSSIGDGRLVPLPVFYALGSQPLLGAPTLGTPGDDVFVGTAGDDHYNGLGGADTISGGDGNDELDGDTGNDVISGESGDDILYGGTGADTLDGGIGNDQIYVDSTGDVVIELAGGGTDRVLASISYTLANGVEAEVLSTAEDSGTDPINLTGNDVANTVYGNNGTNVLFGGGGNDTLYGYDGNDVLFGNAGADAMTGGLGNDGYVVDDAGDTVTEGAGQGTDRIYASVNYTLVAGLSIEVLSTDNAFGTAAITLRGNELANIVYGNYGNNIVYGGAGNDTIAGYDGDDILFGDSGADWMMGGLGDDAFVIDDAGDTVTELAGQGTDRIYASINYALAAGASIETLSTPNPYGNLGITLRGNELNNSVYGDAGNNVLYGLGGDDILSGAEGNDILLGGAGVDYMRGGAGNDSYYVDGTFDTVLDFMSDGGIDRVYAEASFGLLSGAQIEILSTTDPFGTAAITLVGNEFNNTVYGNYGDNLLYGEGGNDTIVSHAGNDTLNGGGGADSMTGGVGDDSYFVDNAGDTVIELAGQGTDRISSTMSYTLAGGLSIEILSTTNQSGTAAINLAGNELGNTIYGNDGSNTLDGGDGDDVLNGYAGNDILIGGAGADTLTGDAGADAFRFNSALGASNIDTISGYVVADDTIQLDDSVFTGLTPSTLAAGAFRIGAAAADADDRIIYNSATGALLFDADGTGAGAAIQFATLTAGLAMTANEFLVI